MLSYNCFLQDSEFVSTLTRLREIPRVQEILSKNEVPSASNIIIDAEGISSEFHSLSFHASPPTVTQSGLTSNFSIINSVRDVSTRLVAFNESTSSEAHSSSVFHAARQIAYWSSLFVSMMTTPATSTVDQRSPTCSSSTSNILFPSVPLSAPCLPLVQPAPCQPFAQTAPRPSTSRPASQPSSV